MKKSNAHLCIIYISNFFFFTWCALVLALLALACKHAHRKLQLHVFSSENAHFNMSS